MNFWPIRTSFTIQKQFDWSKYNQNIRENLGLIVSELVVDRGEQDTSG
jgi:hypothetical protein